MFRYDRVVSAKRFSHDCWLVGWCGCGQELCEAQGCCYDSDEGEFPSCFFGILDNEADQMEWNARQLVTLWGPQRSSLHEYSYRLWGGLVASFYHERWAQWFNATATAVESGKVFNQITFNDQIERFEQTWCRNATAPPDFPIEPTVRCVWGGGCQLRLIR